MKIDYFSDPHFDLWFNPEQNIDHNKFDLQFRKYIPLKPSEVLIIAGDLGHYNRQNIQILKAIKEIYGYKNIICVLGNHDYYLSTKGQQVGFKKKSLSRVAQMRKLINQEDGLYCLDGNIIEIDGIRFGGCDSWYNDEYLKQYSLNENYTYELINQMWKNSMGDSDLIYEVEYFDEIYKLEEPKLQELHNKCYVMITHVNPSHLKEHLDPKWADDKTSTFFSFNGHNLMKNGTMKYWIFGHTHKKIDYEYNGVQCFCNPLGYPHENKNNLEPFKIESLEVIP